MKAATAYLMFALLALLLTGCANKAINRQSLYVSCSKGNSLLVYEIDAKSGALNQTQRVELPAGPGPIALNDEGDTLYAALRNPNQILPLSRDTETGKLTKLRATAIEHFPTYLDIDATSRFALTASYGPGVVNSYALLEDRTVREGPAHFTLKTERTAHASLIDPSNQFVYIPHTTPNAIYQFRFDQTSGQLQPIQPVIVKGGGKPNAPAGPRHYTYHPTLPVIYFVNELDSSVSAYYWDRKTGTLARFQNLTTLPENFTQRNTCADIHITPNGKYLYASNRGHDSIAAYSLDKDGRMKFIDRFETEPVPREFAIDLTGKFLYSAGLRSHKLAAYAIDDKTGRLSRIGTYATPEGPIWVEAVKLD